jgi:predicted amidohydrolase YtcJ
MNRRQFLSSAVAGAATFASAPNTFGQAAHYDLVIRGGRVIDPSVRLDATADVAISGGRIAAVEPRLSADATEIIDARGKLVVPGLLDIHTHCGRAADGPAMVLQDGVTGWTLAPEADAAAYAQKLSEMTADPERYRAMAWRAHQDYEARLNWSVFSDRLWRILEEVSA